MVKDYNYFSGHTSKTELLKVEEYKSRKEKILIMGLIDFSIFGLIYFYPKDILIFKFKTLFFMFLVFVAMNTYFYFVIKEQIRVKRSLY